MEKRSWRDTVVPRYKVQTKGGEEVLERHGRTPLQSTDKGWRRGPGETRSYPATKYRQRVEKRSWRDTVVPRYKVQTKGGEEVLERHGRTPLQSTDKGWRRGPGETRSYPATKYRQRVEKRSWRDTVVPRYKVQTKGGEEVLERHGRTPLQSTDKGWRRGPGETRSYPATKYRQRVEKRSWRDTVVPATKDRQRVEKRSWRDTVVPRYKVQTKGGEEVLERHGRTPLQSTDKGWRRGPGETRSYPATKYRQRVEKRSWRDTVVPRYKVQTKGGEEVLERYGRTPLQSTDKGWRRGPGETRSYPATKYRQRVEKRSWRDTVVPRYKVQITHGRNLLQSTENTPSYPATKYRQHIVIPSYKVQRTHRHTTTYYLLLYCFVVLLFLCGLSLLLPLLLCWLCCCYCCCCCPGSDHSPVWHKASVG